jgi:monoamine oxidase
MDAIARALAAALPAGAVRLGAAIAGVDPAGRVRLADGRVEDAAHIICTLPPPLAATLDGLPPALRAALAAIPVDGAAKLGIQAPRFWEAEGLYGGIAWLPRSMITQLWYPSQGFHAPRGVLVGAYVWDAERAREFGALPPDARAALALREAAALHPALPGVAESIVSVAWQNMPLARGAWAEYAPGTREALVAPMLAPTGRLRFAGDWLSALPGWQEGAVASAYNALSGMR